MSGCMDVSLMIVDRLRTPESVLFLVPVPDMRRIPLCLGHDSVGIGARSSPGTTAGAARNGRSRSAETIDVAQAANRFAIRSCTFPPANRFPLSPDSGHGCLAPRLQFLRSLAAAWGKGARSDVARLSGAHREGRNDARSGETLVEFVDGLAHET